MKKLLFSVTKKDFEINYFSGKGAGGQHRNKHQNCVRMRHPESGAAAVGQSHKERIANTTEAFTAVVNSVKFKLWHNQKTRELLDGETIEEKVKKSMQPEHLRVECRDNGKWEVFQGETK